MVCLQGKRADSKATEPPVLSRAQIDGARDMELSQMFQLIDGMLSFEACLYHQVLPLALEESRLKLGMVNPEDIDALNYVSRILSYMNCSLVSQRIAADTHRAMLSEYLKYTKISKPSTLTEEDPPPNSALPVLEVQGIHLSSPVEELATLPPKRLFQELLRRVLADGIGRLYFERQLPKLGRILWSQNGVLQSVLEDIPLPVFQEVIDELKRLTHLPLISVQEPKQVEIERLYKQNRLLLRLRVMPGAHGEEATLQVLQGAALKFYQQQQLAHLSRDASAIAQKLQHKLNELLKRAQLNPNLSTEQSEALLALNNLLESLDQHMEPLKQLQPQQRHPRKAGSLS